MSCCCCRKADEACPHGLAPTTSTLMQLAIGDALAIALLEARGFTAGDFHVFHPGGKLGASLTHVGDIMHTGDELPAGRARARRFTEAITVLSRKRFGCVGVLDEDGRLCGIVTEGDMARNLSRNLAELDCRRYHDADAEDDQTDGAGDHGARTCSTSINISALIVIDDDRRPIGLVHFHDLLRIGVA